MPQLLASDGATIAYEEAGQGRPLLLVHGWATHGGFFRPQLDSLSSRFRVIAPDLRFHGRSRPAGGEATIGQLADDLRHLCDGLDLTGVLVAGWSMGAMVVWQALLDGMQARAAGMVVIDMAAKVVNTNGWSLGLRGSSPARSTAAAADAMRADWPGVSRRVAQRIFAHGSEDAHPELKAWVAGEIASADAARMADLWTSLTALDFRDRLPALDLPCLIVHGLSSRLYGQETAEDLAGRLPQARRQGMAMSGHAPHLEQPAAFNAAVMEFAATLPPAGRGNNRAARPAAK